MGRKKPNFFQIPHKDVSLGAKFILKITVQFLK